MKTSTFIKNVLFVLMISLSIFVAIYAFAFFAIYDPNNAVHVRFKENPWIGYSHIYGGGLALLVGCFQFFVNLRKNFPKTHKTLGKIYLLAVFI